jgi:hypothetical protein
MKRLLLLSLFIVLSLAAATVWCGKPDLTDGTVLLRGSCTFFGEERTCYLVEKDTVKYIGVWDRWGEHSIYLVLEIPTNGEVNLDEQVVLLWSRASI